MEEVTFHLSYTGHVSAVMVWSKQNEVLKCSRIQKLYLQKCFATSKIHKGDKDRVLDPKEEVTLWKWKGTLIQ